MNALLVTFLLPVTAVVLGGAFRREVFDMTDGVGTAWILAGLPAVDGRTFRRFDEA